VYLQEQGWFVKSARLGNEDAFQKGVQVEDGAAKGNLEIVVSNEGAQLEGTVTDSEKNEPLAAAQIRLRSIRKTSTIAPLESGQHRAEWPLRHQRRPARQVQGDRQDSLARRRCARD
jgi:hypothetical protein